MESPEATEYTTETTQEISTNSNVSIAPQTNDIGPFIIGSLIALAILFAAMGYTFRRKMLKEK